MIKYILLLLVAVGLAQAFVAAFAIWNWQVKNPLINYRQAGVIYFRANFGRYVLVAISTAILCFILSDWMDLNLSHSDLIAKGKAELTRVEQIQLRFKTFAIAIGALIEVIAILVYKAGLQKILDFGKQKGIDI